jgi:hypothetical protein
MIHPKLLARPVCLGAVAAIASVAHANLLINGSFETYTKPSGSWSVPGVVDLGIPVGTTAITGWTVVNGPLDYVGAGGWQASHGSASIDLGGHPGAGGISQSFSTIPGMSYTLFAKDINLHQIDIDESQMIGVIKSVTQKKIVLDVSLIINCKGLSTDLSPKCSETVLFLTNVKISSGFKAGMKVIFTGRDQGKGKPMVARSIKVDDKKISTGVSK